MKPEDKDGQLYRFFVPSEPALGSKCFRYKEWFNAREASHEYFGRTDTDWELVDEGTKV